MPASRRASARLLRWHRRAGAIACVGVLAWTLSGIAHPLMSRMQPRPAAFAPPAPVLELDRAKPLAEVLRAHGLDRIEWFRVVAWPLGSFYQVALPGKAELVYLGLGDGAVLENGDRIYAEHLARHYLADRSSAVTGVDPVLAFGDEYTYINRFLPAYRVGFARADGMRVYVDTASSRLGTLVDTTKSRLSAYFRTLHTWAFLEGYPAARLVVMCALLGCAFATAMIGIWLYAVRFRQLGGTRLRSTHRAVAIAVAASTLLFSFSGGYHLLKQGDRRSDGPSARDAGFESAELAFPLAQAWRAGAGGSIRDVSSVRIGSAALYRFQLAAPSSTRDGHHGASSGEGDAKSDSVFVDAVTGELLPDGEMRYLHSLLGKFAGQPAPVVRTIAAVTRFGDEYGFVFKRLPVTRFELENGVRYYIDASTATLAARIDDGDAREGWVFANLHKLEWLRDPDVRDAVAVALALANALTALLGLALLTRRGARAAGAAVHPSQAA